MAGGGGGLSYDAEVEYIECTKAQYINTGITFNGVTDYEMILDFYPKSYYNYNSIMCIGTGTNNESWIDANHRFYYRYNSVRFQYNISLARQTLRITYNNNTVTGYMDGVQIGSFSASPTTITSPLWLFHRSNYADLYCYGYTLYQNQVKILDYIPVRVGQDGAMYDKVTNTIHKSDTSTPFVAGNDINT